MASPMSGPTSAPAWIGVDWGTTNMRAWAIDGDGAVLDRAASDKGMSALDPHQFEGALLDAIGPWLIEGRTVPVLACGMVGARQGWIEAAYASVPNAPIAGRATLAPTSSDQISVRIVPGLSQHDPADVMRGEETQIAGYVASVAPDGLLCLPGTHSKWVELRGGKVSAFHTEMTGELFSLLGTHSVLRHSVSNQGWDEAAFDRGVTDALQSASPMPLLFGVRAASLLSEVTSQAAGARLSGILIGSEIAGRIEAVRSSRVALIGDERLTRLYGRAIGLAGGQSVALDAEKMTIAGLIAAYRLWKEEWA